MDKAIEETTNFYLAKEIVPRVYSPLTDNYFERHRNSFERHGYAIESYGNSNFMLLTEENGIRIDPRLIVDPMSRPLSPQNKIVSLPRFT